MRERAAVTPPRRRPGCLVARLHHDRREHPVAHLRPGPRVGLVAQVVHAVVRHARPGRRVDVLEAGLVARVVRGEAEHRGEVPAGGTAGHRDERRVAAVRAMFSRTHASGALCVHEVGRARWRAARPVVGGDADPALRRQVPHQRDALLRLVADDPRAAVHLEQHGRARLRVLVTVDVEGVATARTARTARRGSPGRSGGGRAGTDRDVAPRGREVASARARGRSRSRRRAPHTARRSTTCWLSRSADEHGEPGHRDEVQRRRLTRSPASSASRPGARGHGAGDREVVRGELGGQPGAEEARHHQPASRRSAAGRSPSARRWRREKARNRRDTAPVSHAA